MNTLLAGGEVPGLYDGEEYTSLMHECKQAVQRVGLIMDTEEELYMWFTRRQGYFYFLCINVILFSFSRILRHIFTFW